MGSENRKQLDEMILQGQINYRDAVEQMWKSVKMSWEEALEMLKHVEIDPGFNEFFGFCTDRSLPVTVISSGLIGLVKLFLSNYVEMNKELRILANDISVSPEGWRVLFRDDTVYGNDKGLVIREYKSQFSPELQPTVIFVGDGVSDISAALEANIIFAKKGKDLEKYLIRKNITFQPWETFHDVLQYLESISK